MLIYQEWNGENNLTCGIYLIINCINDKIYIGSAFDIEQRWAVHKYHLRNDRHSAKHLQRAWNKYGEENFGFSILELTIEENRVKREQFWLDYTKCYDHKIGYNICKIAGVTIGYKHTEENKRKIGKASLGNTNIRNKEKWPCAEGNKCRCKECREKMRNYWNSRDRKRGKNYVV